MAESGAECREAGTGQIGTAKYAKQRRSRPLKKKRWGGNHKSILRD